MVPQYRLPLLEELYKTSTKQPIPSSLTEVLGSMEEVTS